MRTRHIGRLCLGMALAAVFSYDAVGQNVSVSNVRVSQRPEEYGVVDVYYDLEHPEGLSCDIALFLSKDEGASFPYPATSVSGDVGSTIAPGIDKHIVWRAIDDYPGQDVPAARVRVIAQEIRSFVGIQFVWIPPGTFVMGSPETEQDRDTDEGPQTTVTLTQGFWMSKYVVTKQQWQTVMATTPWSGQPNVIYDPQSPAVYVNWNDAQAFLTQLNELGQGVYRLPTEAEWEYACRTGSTTRFSYGDDLSYSTLAQYAWYDENTAGVGESYAHLVGQKLPNPWGLHDMHGNVCEWCSDWYATTLPGGTVTDPNGPGSGSNRVMRGGGWINVGASCRSARRSSYGPSGTSHGLGFRLVR